MDDFTKAFIAALQWTEELPSEAELPLRDLSLECERFQLENKDLLQRAYDTGYTPEQAGHDFWLTRQGHGAGFWDRGLGEVGDQLTEACKYKECTVTLTVSIDGLGWPNLDQVPVSIDDPGWYRTRNGSRAYLSGKNRVGMWAGSVEKMFRGQLRVRDYSLWHPSGRKYAHKESGLDVISKETKE